MIILKSPFHYKLPKHHIGYSFWITTIKVYCLNKQKYQLIKLFKTIISQQKILTLTFQKKHHLNLTKLI